MNAHRLSLGFLALVLYAVTVQATPGDLDLSFAGFQDGSVHLGQNLDMHAVGPDGKIVLVGPGSSTHMRITRLLSNGSPDPSFGSGGTVLTPRQFDILPRDVTVQPDGKIVVTGYSERISPSNLVVGRFTTTGQPDSTFNSFGFKNISFANDDQIGRKVLIQPDGKIVVAGSAYINTDWDFAAARLLPNGTLDPTFNGDGKATIHIGADEKCYDAALQPDGKLVMVGYKDGTFDSDFAVIRLNVDGTLDSGFDGDGKVVTGFAEFDIAFGVALQADGKIVAAGYNHVARYYSDGSLDGSFNSDGKLTVSMSAQDVAVTPDGKIVLAGLVGSDAYLYRLSPNGTLDTSFQGDGTVLLGPGDSGPGEIKATAVTLLGDGRMLAFAPPDGTCDLYRLWPDTALDAGGRQTLAFDDATFPPGSDEIGSAMAIQSDGKIVVAGQVGTASGTENDFALARFLADGQVDESFGAHGRVAFSFHNFDAAKAVAIQSDGKIVVAGYEGSGTNINFLVARFQSNGSLDPTFGFGGYNVVDFAGGADYGWSVALAPDGKIVMAGIAFNGTINVFGIARFNTDGTLDNTFDGDGKKLYANDASLSHGCTSVIVQSTRKIIAGGFMGTDFLVVRFTEAGVLDDTFGSRGVSRVDMGGSDYLNAMAMASNGAFYGVGARDIGGSSIFAAAKYQSNGLPGTGWPGGKVFQDWGSYSSAWAVDVRGDGQVAVAGSSGSGICWVQYGSGSSTVVASGSTDLPGTGENALAVRFVGSSGLLLGGYQNFNGDRSMVLAQFETTPDATVGVEGVTASPASIRLRAPLPNPLVSRSTITFDLPQSGHVRLSLHDVAGRLVRTMSSRTLPAGEHQFDWDGTDERGLRVPAGVYFVRLDAGSEGARTKVVVLDLA